MLIKEYELQHKLTLNLPNLIWINGDEILIIDEIHKNILKQANKSGFSEKEIIFLESDLNWDALLSASSNMSLFNDKKIIDLRLKTLKLGRKASQQVTQWLSLLSPDIFVIITSAQCSSEVKKTKWYKLINDFGWIVPIWPIKTQQLPNWIVKRARQKKLTISQEAAQSLTIKTEGNLLACDQELTKLALLNYQTPITPEIIYQNISDSSHYNIYQLADSMLTPNIAQTIKILRSLIKEGLSLQIILWSIIKEIRELSVIESSSLPISSNKPVEYLPPSLWQRKLQLYQQLLTRNKSTNFKKMLKFALDIDKSSKGWGDNAIEKTEILLCIIAGKIQTNVYK